MKKRDVDAILNRCKELGDRPLSEEATELLKGGTDRGQRVTTERAALLYEKVVKPFARDEALRRTGGPAIEYMLQEFERWMNEQKRSCKPSTATASSASGRRRTSSRTRISPEAARLRRS